MKKKRINESGSLPFSQLTKEAFLIASGLDNSPEPPPSSDEILEWLKKKAVMREQNKRAKLSKEDVKNIRFFLKKGVLQSDLASRFEITQAHVSRIKRGVSWKRK